MATRDRTTSWNLTDDATFRAWASAIHTAITTAGLVQTADTGQINFATVNRPAADGIAGYAVYRFNDSEQATNPIFLKVYYGAGDLQTQGRLQFEIGKGSNGAGTLTNAAATGWSSTSFEGTDAADRIIHCSMAESAFILLAGASVGANTNFFLCIEREMDAAGAFTGRIVAMGHAGTFVCNIWDGGVWTNVGSNAPGAPMIAMPGFEADPSGRVPVGVCYVKGWRAPLRSFVVMNQSHVADDESGDVTIDGVTRTYIATSLIGALGSGAGPYYHFSANVLATRPLLLNE